MEDSKEQKPGTFFEPGMKYEMPSTVFIQALAHSVSHRYILYYSYMFPWKMKPSNIDIGHQITVGCYNSLGEVEYILSWTNEGGSGRSHQTKDHPLRYFRNICYRPACQCNRWFETDQDGMASYEIDTLSIGPSASPKCGGR